MWNLFVVVLILKVISFPSSERSSLPNILYFQHIICVNIDVNAMQYILKLGCEGFKFCI